MALDIQLRAAQPIDLAADVLVVGVIHAAGKSPSLPPSIKPIDAALGGALSKLAAREEFTGKRDQVLSVATLGRLAADKVVLLGLGDRRAIGAPEARTFAAKAARIANGEKAKSLALAVPAGLEADLRPLAEGLELGAYRFTKYLTGDRKPKAALEHVVLGVAAKLKPTAKAQAALGQKIAAAVNASRDLSNEPPNVIYPETFA
ncbi:MAG TPA: M17 family peptidase N-terminal domain-containing protein, partial [Polyangiaceae bacterium]